ncbi:carbohydrate ABC transporter permease [Brachybacterium squillarum]|uniref:carbohydrate ABC transporter permease n=1 Tax=Brachybacterium squillarum TaxID=661979 RepID=UPI0022215EF4|nr:carbohydrate ABC transporter permease [Brachybacterium squillarum]MCW1805622.1 carbohydrate ABC transporter permease [Brachybacterium squillarum]
MAASTAVTGTAGASATGGSPLRNKHSKYHRRADGSRPSTANIWISRLLLILMLALFLLPVYWMIISAVKSPEELASFPPTLFPKEWRWSNFSDAVAVMPFWRFFANSVIITVSVVILSVVSNFIVAYGFSCIQWPGRDKLFLVVLATLFLPFPVTLIPMFDLWANIGLVNTWGPLIIPAMFAGGFFTFLLRQFMKQIPQDMLNAARVDGASEWRIAWSLVFPTARPAITVVAIFSAVGTWNDFMGPLLYLQDEKKQTLAIGIQAFRTMNPDDVQFNLLMAASILVIIPLVVLFFLFQRYFVSGISLGGFK